MPSPHEPEQLTETELRFLRLVLTEPGLATSTYARRVKLGGSRAKIVRDSLVQGGYVRLHSVTTSRRGRPSIVIELLDKARAALEKED